METPTTYPTGNTAIVPSEYAAFKRIRWGAVIAGAVIATVIFFALNLLGIGIGLTTIDPAQESGNALNGLGIGAMIWYVVSSFLAVFAGGYTAGKMSGFPKKSNAAMHGLLSWAVFTMVGMYLLTTTIGSIFNTVGSAVSSVVSGTGSAIASVVPNNIGDQLYAELKQADISLEQIRTEAMQLLEDTDKAALDPQNMEARAKRTTNYAQRNADDASTSPYQAQREVSDVLNRVKQSGQKTLGAADKEALVNVMVARTDMTEAEAKRAVDGWSSRFEGAMQTVSTKVSNVAGNVSDNAATTIGNATDGIGTAAIISFFALLLGAGAAFFGGGLGRQTDVTFNDGGQTINAVSA